MYHMLKLKIPILNFFLQTTVSYNLQCDGPQGLLQSNFNDAEMRNDTCKSAINKLYFG